MQKQTKNLQVKRKIFVLLLELLKIKKKEMANFYCS
jgi:hypothetical protein